MANTKATVRRLPAVERSNTCSAVKPFKLKEILPQQKTKTIKVRKKYKYFSGRNRLIF